MNLALSKDLNLQDMVLVTSLLILLILITSFSIGAENVTYFF